MWNNYSQSFINDIAQDATSEIITTNLEKALLTLRILRKLTVFGFYKPLLNQDCMIFLNSIFERMKTVLQCRKATSFIILNVFVKKILF